MLSWFPGMDSENAPAADMARPYMVSDAYNGNDLTQYTQDFVSHPDLISSEAGGMIDGNFSAAKGSAPDKHYYEPEDPKAPDDHYAACYSSTTSPYGNVTYADPGFQKDKQKRYPLDTAEHVRAAASYFGMPKNAEKYTPEQRSHIKAAIAAAESRLGIGTNHENSLVEPPLEKHRMFRIKSEDGEFDRGRCIAAYHAILGMRGNIEAANNLPFNVRQHALSRVRMGLNATKAKQPNKELSSHMSTPNEIEVLTARIQELQKAKNLSIEDIMKMVSSQEENQAALATKEAALTDATAKIEKLTASITELTAKVKEFEDTAVSSTRYADLDKILAFTDDEKKDEKHPEFIKSLAALSETDYRVLSLERTVAAAKAQAAVAPERVLSSFPAIATNPVPAFQSTEKDKTELTGADLF